MTHKGLKIALKNDRVERVENAMLGLGQAVNNNLAWINKDLRKIQDELDIIYDEIKAHITRGRFKALVKWLSKK